MLRVVASVPQSTCLPPIVAFRFSSRILIAKEVENQINQLWRIAGWLVNCLFLPNKNATTTEVYLVLPTKRHFPHFFYQRQTLGQQISCLFYLQVSNFNTF